MRKIKIAFEDFWQGFDIYNNYFVKTLKKKYNVEIVTDTADKDVEYLFFSCFGYRNLEYDCIKIFYTGENIVPDFNLCDYAIGYEHLQYDDRYIRMPLYVIDYREDYGHMLEIRGKIKPREKFCSFVASNNKEADAARKRLFDILSKYKKVDAGGRYLNNIGCPDGVVDKQVFQEQYKFSLAVENSSHKGYCTEKLVQAFAAGTIPIYWGDPDVGTYFNEKAFINCHRYHSFEEVLAAVIEIDKNEEYYNKMLEEDVIIDESNTIEAYDRAFEIWLQNIIEQTYKQAYRRSRYGKEQVYKRQIEEWLACEKWCKEFSSKSKIKKIVSIMRK